MTEYPNHGTVPIYITVDEEDHITMRNAGKSDDQAHVYDIPKRLWETWIGVRIAHDAMVCDIAYTYVFPRRDQEEQQ
jgi:hypothetical protein